MPDRGTCAEGQEEDGVCPAGLGVMSIAVFKKANE